MTTTVKAQLACTHALLYVWVIFHDCRKHPSDVCHSNRSRGRRKTAHLSHFFLHTVFCARWFIVQNSTKKCKSPEEKKKHHYWEEEHFAYLQLVKMRSVRVLGANAALLWRCTLKVKNCCQSALTLQFHLEAPTTTWGNKPKRPNAKPQWPIIWKKNLDEHQCFCVLNQTEHMREEIIDLWFWCINDFTIVWSIFVWFQSLSSFDISCLKSIFIVIVIFNLHPLFWENWAEPEMQIHS